MSHEISFNINTGLAEACYANPTWHKLGYNFQPGENLCSDNMKQHGPNFLVELENIYLNGNDSPIANHFALVRQDTRETLTVVGREYRTFQIWQAYDFVDSLWKDGAIQYESVFALKGGRLVILLARMPSIDYVTPDDPQNRYVSFDLSFGFGAIKIHATSVRKVCWNTHKLAREENAQEQKAGRAGSALLTIPHSGDLNAKLSRAHFYLSQLDKKFSAYNEQAKSLLVGCSNEQANEYIHRLFPQPAQLGTSKRVNTTWQDKIDEIQRALSATPQQLKSIRGTWWALFNSITAYIDHGAPAKQSRDLVARAENRFINSTSGPGALKKSEAFELALAMSA